MAKTSVRIFTMADALKLAVAFGVPLGGISAAIFQSTRVGWWVGGVVAGVILAIMALHEMFMSVFNVDA